MKKVVFKCMGVIVLACFSLFAITFLEYRDYRYQIDKNIRNLKLDHVNKLMIVAHPDDETIWGGAHLLEDDYLVICITCGERHDRVLEFQKVMSLTKDAYLMLGYPDKNYFTRKRDNWNGVKDALKVDLKRILALKDWDVVITHNPEGEYGHPHHKMTSIIMTSLYEEKYQNKKNLYYFGKYYRPKELTKSPRPVLKENDAKTEKEKVTKLIEVYKTQKFIKKTFKHMFPYENWVQADAWGEGSKI